MLTVRNVIKECDDRQRRERALEGLTRQAHHRIRFAKDDGERHWPDVEPIPDEELTGPLVAGRFADVRQVVVGGEHWADRPGRWTGGQTPYTFLGRTDGVLDQCLEVGDVGPHAGRWNIKALGIAWAGDFRMEPPTSKQWTAAVEFAALWLAWGLDIYGHSPELPGGSKDPKKECPGRLFPTEILRQEARIHPKSKLALFDAEKALLELEVVF